MKFKVGFIGTGNMGGALLRAAAKAIGGENICAADMNSEKLEAISNETGCATAAATELAKSCEFIFVGVKPAVFGNVFEEINEALSVNKEAVIVTMAAGLTLQSVKAMSGDKPVIRIMPNTAAEVGKAMILLCATFDVTKDKLDGFKEIMRDAGKIDELDEKLIDAASAVSGCGPAFVYMFIEALSDGAVACGLPRDKAIEYAAQTLIGAAETVLKTGRSCGELKDAVCSPGGTTIEGVKALENGGFRGTAMNAVVAAYKKTIGK